MSTKRKSRFSPFWKQCFVTASVGSNIIGHGAVIGYPGILLPQLHLVDSAFKLDAASASWIASILGITQLVGSFISPPIMEKFGRRAAHFTATVPNLIGWFVITMATNFEVLFAGRILQGLSIGMLSPLRSVLIGEYSSPKNRGAFLTTVSLSQSFGIFFVHLVGSLLSWQQAALICSFFPFISIIMTIYSPESPSWLVTKGRHDECRRVFRWLRGDDEEDELEEMIEGRLLYEKAMISASFNRKNNRIRKIITTIKKKEFYKPIILMMHAHVLVNFAGGTTMSAYSTMIIGVVMGPQVNAHFWMIFLGAQRFVSNTLAVFAINKFKRRTMMFATGGLSIFAQFALAAYVYFKQQGTLPYDAVWIPILLINLKFFAVATGMLPLPNVIGGEVFPLEYRSIGGTISLASFSATFFLVLKTFTGLVESVGMYGTYVVYGCIITYCMVVIWFLLPETKDRTLQQIEDEFRGRPLGPEEIEVRKSLQADPIVAYKRKMSARRCSSLI
ncbi:facilitated trehalose transporter Tret1-like [Spodoptera litura]|uniref:Facilitated trehalose transporter Tret1-like n=1 Tax=Spodoptera litura TaxID=69820 RepID=A0A9J7EQK8_SPOLT|nr:facilitated trehalose transporter Tret1-like [Spodoptera litura]XP_022836140.1 facilitated trehalose transporter Tret1-like [Spodoptera litura]XP_022836148.1 facilitated trehalose transporter Tret1-like [Spodoptera litura]XP_022836154.1 facilitated trehalose transporter Tret1-like [Spodoptera litura]